MQAKIRLFLVIVGMFLIMGCPGTGPVELPATPAIEFLSVAQAGGASFSANTTSLVLTFSADPVGLSAADIALTGATKGVLKGTGATRTLIIPLVKVKNADSVAVSIPDISSLNIKGSTQNAIVYRFVNIGEAYQGGIVAYVFTAGNPGYVAGEQHGLIIASSDLTLSSVWALGTNQTQSVTTSTAIGTGQVNTEAIVLQNSSGTTYAAGACESFINVDDGFGLFYDWFLPSQGELDKVYLSKAICGGFRNSNYATSSQYSSSEIWAQNFEIQNQFAINKNMNLWVRPVRYF